MTSFFADPEPPMPAATEPLPRMTIPEAIHLLPMHKRRIHRIGDPPGGWKRPRSLAEMHASILKKLSALTRRRGLI